jgi:hypothetical protein
MATLTLDTTVWTADERVMVVASVLAAAYLDCSPPVSTVGHSQARWSGQNVSIDLPNASSSDLLQLTEAKVRAQYTTGKAARDAAQAAYEAEIAAQASYVGTDPILDAKVADIIAYVNQTRTDVNNAGNVTALKAACLRIIQIEENILRLLYARGLIGAR